jgi:hypothetical protein
MRPSTLCFASIMLLAPFAVDAAKEWQFEYRPAEARYAIYGGELGDEIAPNQKDKKISLYIEGAAARDIFEFIGPDLTDVCGADKHTRVREKDKGAVSCSHSRKDGYRCYFGFDLRTGKSIGGVTC